jgi:3-hydroxyacyl-CoA dehydrogenase / enoyl-CoA hydratase / 3-hydroxybutyryl-CoA epimerase
MNNAFQLNIEHDGVARLVFDLPGEKINTLSMQVMLELEKHLDTLAANKEIKALEIVSGKEDSFIAGADLRSFGDVFKDPALAKDTIETGHRIFNKIGKLPFPTIALIHGICVGGGLELALACTYRVVTDHPKTQLGLPEVTLGIIPGWGGTQRTPRLIGLIEGLGLILSGKPLKAQKAWKVHLADAIVAWEFKEEKLDEFVDLCLTPQGAKKIVHRRKPKGMKHWLLEANPLGRAYVFHKAKQDTLNKTKGHYPAPLLALQVIKDSYTLPLNQGLEVEKKAILGNLSKASAISKNLIHLFFVSEALKKDAGVPDATAASKINSVGVLGAGVMGSGIAWVLSKNDFSVRMKDVDYNALGKGFGAISELYHKAVKDRRMKKNEAALKFQHISGTVDFSGFNNVDLVIEAATENLDLKNKLFLELETRLPKESIIASNTSSLSIAEMAKIFKSPERFIGMHFFNPVPRMPLVEIVPGEKTSPKTIAAAVEFCKKIGKTPIVVEDCPGFLVNRIFAMGANELMFLYEEGIDRKRIDQMMLDFGYPMGPFSLADEVGIDVLYKVNQVLEKAYGERMKGPKLMQEMYEKKLLGKKGGKGFYIYEGKKSTFNPEIAQLVKTQTQTEKTPSEIEMSDRVMLGMINEAARCLQENIIKRPDYLDMALIMGTGFPPFRGGLLKYADDLGISYVVDQLEQFTQKYGMRFTPCPLLLEMKQTNKKFYT